MSEPDVNADHALPPDTAMDIDSCETEPLVGHGSALAGPRDPDQTTRSSGYLFVLSLGIGGLQVVYSVLHSSGTPFLLSLGMSKALLACVWVAGPLAGTIVQPYIGIRSDQHFSRWGKRKPFMALGGLGTAICLLTLAWIREIVGGVFALFNQSGNSDAIGATVIFLAAVLNFALDFFMNTVQAAMRAFIVDNAPSHQQESANAWATRQNGVGDILGFCLGFMNLPATFPFLGNTQFKGLCVVASVSILITLAISTACIKEQNTQDQERTTQHSTFMSYISLILKSIRRLSPHTKRVFAIQFTAWFGWFSFLFYASTYIGQFYVDPIFEKQPNLSDNEINQTWEHATRIGTFALFIKAIIAFAASIILPLLTAPPAPSEEQEPSSSTQTNKGLLSHLSQKLRIPGLTLQRLWLFSHFLFAGCMFSTFVIGSTVGASVMVGVIGISWAITTWAPFAFISAEIAQHQDDARWLSQCPPAEASSNCSSRSLEDTDADGEVAGQAGIILGLHNVFISTPQIVSSFVGSVVFKALQKPRGEPHDTSVAWVLRLGGVAAVVAGFLTTTLREQEGKKGLDR